VPTMRSAQLNINKGWSVEMCGDRDPIAVIEQWVFAPMSYFFAAVCHGD